MVQYSLSLDNSDPGKNWLLQLYTEDTEEGVELATKFKEIARLTFGVNKFTHWFLQGESKEWKMFEFWTNNHDAILNYSMLIAETANLHLELGQDSERLQSVLKLNWSRRH